MGVFTRTVTNAGSPNLPYAARPHMPPNVSLNVEPSFFIVGEEIIYIGSQRSKDFTAANYVRQVQLYGKVDFIK